MKKSIYVLAVTLVIATLVISSTASIPIIKNNSDTGNNSVNDYETSVTPKNSDNFIQRLMRLFSGEIIDVDISDSAAINSSKIDGVPSHNHDERYYTQAEVDALLSNCSGHGVINIEDKFGLTTSAADASVTVTYDIFFPDIDYFIFVRVILAADFDPGSGNIPAGTVVETCGITKSTTNFKAVVCYLGELLKGADVDIFYIAIEQ